MRLAPDVPALIEQGRQLHRQGRLAEAEDLYRRALTADPDNADALHLLGVLANQQGDHGRAAELIREALGRKPTAAHYHSNLGIALMGLGDLEGADAQFAAELELNPGHAAALLNRGALFVKQGKNREAVELLRLSLRQNPDDVVASNNLGFALVQLHALDEAWDMAQTSLRIKPGDADAYNLLGLVSRHRGNPDEALDYFSRALQTKPNAAEILLNLGVAHKDLGQFDQALAAFDRAIRLQPDYPDPHFSRALVLLARGDFERGWPEYEYGLLCNERRGCPAGYPRWRGESLLGKNILICAEQGLGDEIMFASMLPEIISEARHCVVECNAKLVGLYRRSFPGATIVATQANAACMSETLARLPAAGPIHVQSPVGSLALYRRSRMEDFPVHRGYLTADAAKVARWRERLGTLGPGLKIGISWRGGTLQTGALRRSIPLVEWLPLLTTGGVRFVSLQYTDCGDEIAALERLHGIRLPHWQEAIDDYDETAALVSALDLVITVQTAVFHLSGALGRPVWGLLPVPAEWRYLSEGPSLPWYPSARLFRQSVPGVWGSTLEAAAAELGALVRTCGPGDCDA